MRAKKNSSQAFSSVKMAVAARPGAASGRATWRNAAKAAGAVHTGGLFQLSGHALKVAGHDPDHKGQAKGRIGQDESQKRIEQPGAAQHTKQRDDQRHGRQQLAAQHDQQQRALAWDIEAREGVGRQRAQEHRHPRRADADDQAIAQRQDKGRLAAGLAKGRRLEDIDVVAEGDLGRDDRARAASGDSPGSGSC